MMLKTSTVSISSCVNIIQSYTSFYSQVFAPCGQNHSSKASFRFSKQCRLQQRDYAGHPPKSPPPNQSDNLPWPELPSAMTIPTPYQIFQLNKDAPYSKSRFYELVKLYHPDRHSCQHSSSDSKSLLPHVRVERYRLVVAANDILSDPTKRRAYDECGAGWGGCPNIDTSEYAWNSRKDYRWSGFETNSSPARNATWEDWEKWYENGNRQKQAPVFFSNKDFLCLLFCAMVLGAIGQATRLEDRSKSISDRVEAVYDSCNRNIQHRRKTSHSSESRQERVQDFLETRDS